MILVCIYVLFVSARPDPETIKYFARIVSICTESDKELEEEKGDKLADIMCILALSEAELEECKDAKSIRNTCRKVVRLVFHQQLADPNVSFGDVLKEKKMIAAIRSK